ncbi:hypothetical protein THF1D04_10731 [Vibrio owensii]|uniref:Uncharacterized protein n=1 Tax=Vibrio owensii TaxID=696485 RepID=A0AAU9Q190_9VIBR|nr:hypothetical protein THF1D04_10731 [Vibrio owensii]
MKHYLYTKGATGIVVPISGGVSLDGIEWIGANLTIEENSDGWVGFKGYDGDVSTAGDRHGLIGPEYIIDGSFRCDVLQGVEYSGDRGIRFKFTDLERRTIKSPTHIYIDSKIYPLMSANFSGDQTAWIFWVDPIYGDGLYQYLADNIGKSVPIAWGLTEADEEVRALDLRSKPNEHIETNKSIKSEP